MTYAIPVVDPERVLAVTPGLRFRMRANRALLGRATRYLVGEAGIRQFLDIGTGIPAAGKTHEVAQRAARRSLLDPRLPPTVTATTTPPKAHIASILAAPMQGRRVLRRA